MDGQKKHYSTEVVPANQYEHIRIYIIKFSLEIYRYQGILNEGKINITQALEMKTSI